MATQENTTLHGLVLILSPTGCTEGCVYFPQSCRNTHLPPFSRLSTQYHIDPFLTCFLSLDTSRTSLRLQQSTKFGNRHTAHGRYEYSYNLANSRENWAPKKKSLPGHVLVAMRERPCEPVTGSVVLEPPVGFMVLISPRSPGMPSPSRPAGGLRAVKQLRRYPLP